MMVSMNTKKQSNNERLTQLVALTGLTRAKALERFNQGLGVGGYSYEYWKGFFCDPATRRFKPLSDELLAHAENVFGKKSAKS